MSKNNNVNPGQYKVAGRERPGEDINPQKERAKLAENMQQTRTKGARARRSKRKS